MSIALLSWGDAGWGDEMALGALMTIVVATSAFLMGIVLGSGFAAAKLSRHWPLRLLSDVYTTVVRGVPELLIIFLVFFGGGSLIRYVANGLFGFQGYVEPPVFIVGVMCIGVSAGAYCTEVIRAAVLAIPKGQLEAAKAVGMGRFLRLRRVLIPQAARYALPGLGNIWQYTLKDTSLISVIGLVEIMRAASSGAGSTHEPFTFYLAAFICFLLLSSLSNRGFLRAEKWANRGVKGR
ncbi:MULTISPECIES: ABC transporter permease [unclassified Mesorhizobium]|uniref:ABC transporter permease n=1 Tax=unclassified Mesorhizobium TaxID=325217 RepID=UPI00112A81CF|nr:MULTISPECIES: ABC transporter permease [unclassified Mesorhizobium]TPL02148.1 ABC transporter permease [Mesorhizobium sp. B2-4-16]TPL78407.1 ABC transporter permease [Mesorhizobium sp. B2-4-3]